MKCCSPINKNSKKAYFHLFTFSAFCDYMSIFNIITFSKKKTILLGTNQKSKFSFKAYFDHRNASMLRQKLLRYTETL